MSMRILLTNDDGIDAPGLAILEEIARALSDDVWIVAPATNQSGAGHRMTFGHELELIEHRARVFSIDGAAPADCVVVGMTHVLGDRPADLVLSGVNNGQNFGDVIHASGTAAGGRAGALHGALGIALSQAIDYHNDGIIDWAVSRQYGAAVVGSIVTHAEPGVWFNVNFPFCRPEAVSGVRVVPAQRFDPSPFRYFASDNRGKFFVAIPEKPVPLAPDADYGELSQNSAITVTPILLQASDIQMAARLDGKISAR